MSIAAQLQLFQLVAPSTGIVAALRGRPDWRQFEWWARHGNRSMLAEWVRREMDCTPQEARQAVDQVGDAE